MSTGMAEENTLGARHSARPAAMMYFMLADCVCTVGNGLYSFLGAWEGMLRGGCLCIARRSGSMDEIELMCWNREDRGNQSWLYILHISELNENFKHQCAVASSKVRGAARHHEHSFSSCNESCASEGASVPQLIGK